MKHEINCKWLDSVAFAPLAQKSAEKLLGNDAVIEIEKITGGEDFALFLEKALGAFAFVGVRNEQKEACYPHHHARFNIDEDGLEIGTALYVQYAVDFFNE